MQQAEREQKTTVNAELLEKMDALLRDRELECLQAVDEERRKWEAREQRLLTQVTEMIITPEQRDTRCCCDGLCIPLNERMDPGITRTGQCHTWR